MEDRPANLDYSIPAELLTEFSIEQVFNQRMFEMHASKMSREQLIEFVVNLHYQLTLKDIVYKKLFKQI